MARSRACPCGSARAYDACCGPLHAGTTTASTAEELMRSRYSAFAVGDAAHLLRTWHPATRPERLDLDDSTRWTGLEVLATEAGGPQNQRGVVEFRASYTSAGEAHALHEVSRFRRHDGQWCYVRGRATWS